jgi:hypothetical protein
MLQIYWFGTLSLTRGRVCPVPLLLALLSTVILGPSSVGLAAIFYCLRFDTSLFVASYDTQGYSGNIRPHLHKGRTLELSNCLSLMLRPTVSRPVCLGIKHLSVAYDQIYITFSHLLVCWYGALPLTRGLVCRVQLLVAFANAVILESESRGSRYHILLSHIRDFPFRRLLRLAGLRVLFL